MRVLHRILLLVPVLLATGCTPAAGGRARQPEPDDRTTVRVDNRSWNAVNVYAIRSSQRIRLGTVQATSTTVLEIPRTLVSGITTLRFQIDPIGSNRTPISEQISVSPGEQVELIVPNTGT
ncbi:MAG TPA: hypothetical protein VHG28_10870 [Longimicrobiaceae bacterium]|nr:hypothetical protein [Longimicrobiaceae bacterium]